MNESRQAKMPSPERRFVQPSFGEQITSEATGNTYDIGARIGEGNFGIAFRCIDVWGNDLAAKVLKPKGTYQNVRESAVAEFEKLLYLRHPNVTYVYDAFEFRDTFYIITERCHDAVTGLFSLQDFNGNLWLMPIARCLLQAVHYLHLNQYAHQDIHSGNVLTAFARNEVNPNGPGAIQFKLGDLGVSKVFSEIDVLNTLNDSIRPPEAIDPTEFGPIDHRIDIYQTALLLLQFAASRQIQFSRQQVLDGLPRQLALDLPAPLNFALEKALRRHAKFRTETAMELWRDLNSGVSEPTPQLVFPGLEPSEFGDKGTQK
jgi:serine/threonine protein kinase